MMKQDSPHRSPELPGNTGTIHTTNRLTKQELAQILSQAKIGATDVHSYFAQPDAHILDQIRSLAVPTHILLDEGGWQHLCAVHRLHANQVSVDQWSALCQLREVLC